MLPEKTGCPRSGGCLTSLDFLGVSELHLGLRCSVGNWLTLFSVKLKTCKLLSNSELLLPLLKKGHRNFTRAPLDSCKTQPENPRKELGTEIY